MLLSQQVYIQSPDITPCIAAIGGVGVNGSSCQVWRPSRSAQNLLLLWNVRFENGGQVAWSGSNQCMSHHTTQNLRIGPARMDRRMWHAVLVCILTDSFQPLTLPLKANEGLALVPQNGIENLKQGGDHDFWAPSGQKRNKVPGTRLLLRALLLWHA